MHKGLNLHGSVKTLKNLIYKVTVLLYVWHLEVIGKRSKKYRVNQWKNSWWGQILFLTSSVLLLLRMTNNTFLEISQIHFVLTTEKDLKIPSIFLRNVTVKVTTLPTTFLSRVEEFSHSFLYKVSHYKSRLIPYLVLTQIPNKYSLFITNNVKRRIIVSF